MADEVTNHNQENKPEQELELARLKAQEAADRRRALELEEEHAREAAASQKAMFNATLEAELLRGQYALPANLDIDKLTRIAEVHGFEFKPEKNGRVIRALRNGKELDTQQALKELFAAHSELIDKRSSGWKTVAFSDERIRSKKDLPNPNDVVAYIEERGLAAFEKLPLRPLPDSPKDLTADEWRRLPLALKVKFTDEIGTRGVEEVMKRKSR
jgi:hypothetical protein